MGSLARPLLRTEKALILTLIIGQVFFAPFLLDFFPFSTYPMFSDSPYGIYVIAPGEGTLPSDFDKIQRSIAPYLANPEPKLSREMPSISAKDLDRTWILDELKRGGGSSSPGGTILRFFIGAKTENRVGVLSSESWALKED